MEEFAQEGLDRYIVTKLTLSDSKFSVIDIASR